jgi:hypothetical protein
VGTSPEDDRTAEPEASRPRAVSGVRTEHQLRVQLRQALERNATFERALRESAAYAYGRREIADLRKLRAVLWAAGFPDPNSRRKASEPDAAEASGPAEP